jgi:hypothetical protein
VCCASTWMPPCQKASQQGCSGHTYPKRVRRTDGNPNVGYTNATAMPQQSLLCVLRIDMDTAMSKGIAARMLGPHLTLRADLMLRDPKGIHTEKSPCYLKLNCKEISPPWTPYHQISSKRVCLTDSNPSAGPTNMENLL